MSSVHRRCNTPGGCLALALFVLTPFANAQSVTQFQVAQDGLSDSIQLADSVLSEAERDFIRNHPSLRVAVAAVPRLPFQSIEGNVISGHAIRFLQSVATANGLELEYQVYPSMRAVLEALRNREADITPIAQITDERRRYLAFTSGITPNPAGLIGKKSDRNFNFNPQLKGKRVLVVGGNASEFYLKSQFPRAISTTVDSPAQALSMIRDGLADYYYGPLQEVFFAENRNNTELLEIKQRVFYSTGWNHIAVRSDWPIARDLIDRFAYNGRQRVNPVFAEGFYSAFPVKEPSIDLSSSEIDYLSQFSSIKVATVDGVPLLNDISSNGHHVGIASEFTAYIAHQLGLPVELKSFPSVELMLEALAQGDVDVSPYFAITDERRKTLLFSSPYLQMPWLVVGRTHDTMYWDLGSLEGKTLAIRNKHPLQPLIEKEFPDIELLITDVAAESMEAVANGEADATIETKLYINRSLTQNYAGRLQVLGEVAEAPGEFAFAVDPRDRMLVSVINKALDTLDPEFTDRVIRRWVAVDFEPERQLRKVLQILVPAFLVVSAFLLALIYWNRRIHKESRRRLQAEQRLVDMTDKLQTGVFQFRQYPKQAPVMEFANKQMRSFCRVKEGDLYGSDLDVFAYIDSEDRERVRSRMRHCMANGIDLRETFRFDYPNGEKGWLLLDATCREQFDGARVWSGYLFDLTSERLMSEELNSALSSRNEFISMASHELRTPVQNVLLSLESIDRRTVTPELSKKLAYIESAANDLDQLVNDILHLNSLNHNAAVLSTEPVELHDLVDKLFHGFRSAAKKKNLAFSLTIDDDVPNTVITDPLRLKQILYNVTGNAIKYTTAGSVSVRVSALKSHQSATERLLSFAIEDTGIGIDQSNIENIFEPFSTVGPASLRSSGLGLTLSRRLAAIMGGSIEVQSVEGEGSTFIVNIPLRTVTPEAEETDKPSVVKTQRWNSESETILVVDDNLLVRETLASVLGARGWRVLQAENGSEALQHVKQVACKAVVSDQLMPGVTGVELAQKIKELFAEDEARPVLIMMSGGMDTSTVTMATRVFDAMLFKPVRADSIISAIEDVTRTAEQPVKLSA